MAALDHTLELGLAVTWLGVTAVIAFAVLSVAYAAIVVGGGLVSTLVALVFVAFGSVIVYGSLKLYAPTTNPVEAFRRLLTYEWADQTYYHCEGCDRSYTQPGQLEGLACPYCGSADVQHLAG